MRRVVAVFSLVCACGTAETTTLGDASTSAVGRDATGARDATDAARDAFDATTDGGVIDASEVGVIDSPWVVYATGRAGAYDLHRVRLDGCCWGVLTNAPGLEVLPSFFPDGRVIYVSDEDGEIGLRIRPVTGGPATELRLPRLIAPSAPAVSPDGQRIAFEARPSATSAPTLYLLDLSRDAPVRLFDDTLRTGGAAWSPDGARLYFLAEASGRFEIHSVDYTGTDRRSETPGVRVLGRPAPSPDGAALVYTRATGDAMSTELVRLDLSDR